MESPQTIVDKLLEDIDPEEVEQVAATPGPQRFVGRDNRPIAVGDIVITFPAYSDYEDDVLFIGKVVGTERGFLQVLDPEDNSTWDFHDYDVAQAPPDQRYRVESKKVEKWIGVDLDGTLAKSGGKFDPDKVGEPIGAMVKRVKDWLEQGKKVKIFTARASTDDFDPAPIKAWCEKHLGQELEITCEKDIGMEELWDDRAVQVVKNTGEVVEDIDPEEVEALAMTPTNLWQIGFQPVSLTNGRKWQKTLGSTGTAGQTTYYYAEVFPPDEQKPNYRLHIISAWRGQEGASFQNLLKHVDVRSIVQVQDEINEFLGRVKARPMGEDIEPEEVEQIAHQALAAPWAVLFMNAQFNYTPEDGSFYKKWRDLIFPSRSYVMRVVPRTVDEKPIFDIYWKYIDAGTMDSYATYTTIRGGNLADVSSALQWGKRMIAAGRMWYEMTHI